MTEKKSTAKVLRLVAPPKPQANARAEWTASEMLHDIAETFIEDMGGALVVFRIDGSDASAIVMKIAEVDPSEAIAMLEIAKAQLIADLTRVSMATKNPATRAPEFPATGMSF
jgi:hypothetical protein